MWGLRILHAEKAKVDTQVLEGVYAKEGYCEECHQDTTPFLMLPFFVMENAYMQMVTVFVCALCPVCHTPQHKEVEVDDPDHFYAKYPAMRSMGEMLRQHAEANSPIDWPTDKTDLCYEEKIVLANAIRVLAEDQYRQNMYYLPRLAMEKDLTDAISGILEE